MLVPFTKAHGTGNSFIILYLPECPDITLNKHIIQFLCQYKSNDSIDGLLAISNNERFDFKMDYYNNDGSWETMCANGALCVLLVLEENKFKFDTYKFMAGDGEHQIRYNDNNLSIKMKSPSNKTQDVNIQGHTGAHIDSGAKHFVTCCDLRDTNQLFEIAKSIR